MSKTAIASVLTLLAAGCGEGKDEAIAGCDEKSDADSDGLSDCEEEALGSDPAKDDTDGDGLTDLEEVDCGTSALDADDTCYACGWGNNDPGNIQATGAGVDDIMENVTLVDQCGERVSMYDFAGAYHLMYMTTAG